MHDSTHLDKAQDAIIEDILKDFPFTQETVMLSGGREVARIKGPGVNYYINPIEGSVELNKYRAAYLLGRTHPGTPAVLERILRVLYFAEAVIHPKHRTRIAAAIKEVEQLIDQR